MAKQKSASADKTLVKLGHAVTPAAQSLLAMMAELDGVPESVLLEAGIRALFDVRPTSHRDALSTLLRAKGHNIRDLRKTGVPVPGAENPGDESTPGQGRGPTPAPAAPAPPPAISGKATVVDVENVVPGLERRNQLVAASYERAVAPYDAVLEDHGRSDLT